MSVPRHRILSPLLILALVAVSCLCVWLLFGSRGNDQPRPPDPSEGSASESGNLPTVGFEGEGEGDGGHLVTRPFVEGSGTGRAPTGSGFAVRAVLAATGDPVAGAEVRFIDTSDLESWQNFWEEARRGSADLWLRQEGTDHRTGVHGWTLVPSFRRSAILVAAKGNLRSTTRWYERLIPEQADEELILELRPVDPFDVRVVDHAGRVAPGIPVGVMHQTQTRRHFSNVQRTGPDGVVRFYRPAASGGREAGGAQWIAAAIPAIYPPTIPYPRGTLGTDPLTLTLPPTAELLVHVRDAMGQLYQKTAWVDIVVEQRPSRAGEILGVRSMTQFTDNGVARF